MHYNDLTMGEKLYVYRKRLGLNQSRMGRYLYVGITLYNKAELDRCLLQLTKPIPDLGELTESEELKILRRRRGLTHKDLSKSLNCSRVWILAMENGLADSTKLREFYDQ